MFLISVSTIITVDCSIITRFVEIFHFHFIITYKILNNDYKIYIIFSLEGRRTLTLYHLISVFKRVYYSFNL